MVLLIGPAAGRLAADPLWHQLWEPPRLLCPCSCSVTAMRALCDVWPRSSSVSRESVQLKQDPTCAASLAAVLVQMQTLSCLARTFTTMPQISSPSVNCSPMHASSCSRWQGCVRRVPLGRGPDCASVHCCTRQELQHVMLSMAPTWLPHAQSWLHAQRLLTKLHQDTASLAITMLHGRQDNPRQPPTPPSAQSPSHRLTVLSQ